MFFEPARSQGYTPSAGGLPAQRPDAAFAAFLATSSRPLEQLQQQQQLRLAAVAANPWGGHSHPQPISPAGPYAGPTGSTGGSYPAMPPSGYPALPSQQQQQQQRPYMHGGLQMQPASGPPSASTQGIPGSELGLVAQPGESDEAFAQRLAAMYGSSPGGSVSASLAGAASAASTAANSAAPSRLGSSTAPARPQGQDSSNPFTQGPQASDNPFRAHGSSEQAQVPQQQQPQQQQQLDPARMSDGAPSAPTATAATAAAVAASDSGADSFSGGSDADLCVICLSAPREVGLLHGTSVHKCLCKECAPMVRTGTPCPMCRQIVERVLGVY